MTTTWKTVRLKLSRPGCLFRHAECVYWVWGKVNGKSNGRVSNPAVLMKPLLKPARWHGTDPMRMCHEWTVTGIAARWGMPKALIHETWSYMGKLADDTVDWQASGKVPFVWAKEENKLASIRPLPGSPLMSCDGFREFQIKRLATLMSHHFINVKLGRPRGASGHRARPEGNPHG